VFGYCTDIKGDVHIRTRCKRPRSSYNDQGLQNLSKTKNIKSNLIIGICRRRLELVFRISTHHLQSLTDDNDIPASSLKVLGEPLIVRNIKVASKVLAIDTIKIPDEFPDALRLIQDNFPSINVEKFHDNNKGSDNDDNNKNDNLSGNSTNYENNIKAVGGDRGASSNNLRKNTSIEIPINSINKSVEIPINTIIRYSTKSSSYIRRNSNSSGSGSGSAGHLVADSITYPWDFLNAVEKILREEVTETVISPNASVAKSSIIKGPCIIEDNVTIDDFCKIKGPTYIGNGSFIGTGSLIRDCMIGNNTKIGFSCETGRTYFAGNDEIAHLNIILDSVIGKNVWFGGFSRTANVLLTKREKNIQYVIGDGKSVDLGTHHFGSIIGNNCTIGTYVVLLPGRYVPANTVIADETTFGKKIVMA